MMHTDTTTPTAYEVGQRVARESDQAPGTVTEIHADGAIADVQLDDGTWADRRADRFRPLGPASTSVDRYSAWLDDESLTLIHDRWAGVSGPMQSVPSEGVVSLAAAEAWIERQGFRLVAGWRLDRNYTGLLLIAEVEPIN